MEDPVIHSYLTPLRYFQLSNDDREKDIKIMLDRSPPPIERHLENSETLDPEWPTLLTVSSRFFNT